jgi:hypothetical protein
LRSKSRSRISIGLIMVERCMDSLVQDATIQPLAREQPSPVLSIQTRFSKLSIPSSKKNNSIMCKSNPRCRKATLTDIPSAPRFVSPVCLKCKLQRNPCDAHRPELVCSWPIYAFHPDRPTTFYNPDKIKTRRVRVKNRPSPSKARRTGTTWFGHDATEKGWSSRSTSYSGYDRRGSNESETQSKSKWALSNLITWGPRMSRRSSTDSVAQRKEQEDTDRLVVPRTTGSEGNRLGCYESTSARLRREASNVMGERSGFY